MDPTKFSGCDSETQQPYMDFNWSDFVDRLFQQAPQDPFFFYMEWLEDMSERKVSELLGMMLVKGAKILYNKEIAQLAPEEIETLQRYYRSLGYQVDYAVETKDQYIAKMGKVMPVNFFQIDFKPCSQRLNTQNQPMSMAHLGHME